MSTSIRQAQPADAFALAALAVRAGREAGHDPDRTLVARWADAWLASWAVRPTWIAEDDGVPVGLLTASVAPLLPALGDAGSPASEATQVWLYVVPERRRTGIGARLAQAGLHRASEEGVRVAVDLDQLGEARDGIGRRVERSGVRPAPVPGRGCRRPVPAGTRG